MSSRTDRNDPVLQSLRQELDGRIVAGGEPLRECFRRFEEVYSQGGSRKKLAPAVLIECAAEAALAHSEPLKLLQNAIEFMPAKHGPASVLDGILRLERTEKRNTLLYEFAGQLETAPSTDLISKLASELGAAFPYFPINVWNCSKSRHNDPRWCRIWGRTCQDVINAMPGKSLRIVREVLEQIHKIIEQVTLPGAEGLVPLVLVLLGRDTAEISSPFPQNLLNTPAGKLALTHVNSLAGRTANQGQRFERSGEMPSVPLTQQQSILSRNDFPMEPQLTLFQIWSSLGECLLSSKDQNHKARNLEATNQELKTRLEALEQETARQREELVRLQKNLEQEQERGARLFREQETLIYKADEAGRERDQVAEKLNVALKAYDRLDGQSAKEKSSWRDQMLMDLLVRLQQPCEETAEMLEMALVGDKNITDVVPMWNRFDEALARCLGRERLRPVALS